MFSAPQKRLFANGRSFDTHSTTVFGYDAAFLLNVRTDVAQVLVSMLGKMLSTIVLPARSLLLTVDRSVLTNVNAGAVAPGFGRSPIVATGEPFRVTFAMVRSR